MHNFDSTCLKVWVVLAGVAATVAPGLAWSQGTSGASRPLDLRLVVIDGSKTAGSTIGLEYKYGRKWAASGDSSEADSADFDFARVGLWDRTAEIRGQGTIAASAERNPNKLVDLTANVRYDHQGDGWIAGLGASIKAETDQKLDDKQFVYGLQGRAWLNNPLGARGWAMLYVNLGRVEPRGDAAREKALGRTGLPGYRRWDAELVVHKDLSGSIGSFALSSLEFQYRYFAELSSPAAVVQSGLDKQRLGTLRVSFGDDKFLAFSRGRLPFDRQSDRAVKIGWAQKF